MGVIADIYYSHPKMAGRELLERTEGSIVIHLETPVNQEDGIPTAVISAERDESITWEEFEQLLEEDPTVREATAFGGGEHCQVYHVTMEPGSVVLISPLSVKMSIHIVEAWSVEGPQWRVRIHAPSRSHLTRYFEECKNIGASIELNKLYERTDESPGGRAIHPESVLTDDQWAAMSTAYKMGYFNQPRECSLDDVGAELEVSASATGRRIQRGVSNLIGAMLSSL